MDPLMPRCGTIKTFYYLRLSCKDFTLYVLILPGCINISAKAVFFIKHPKLKPLASGNSTWVLFGALIGSDPRQKIFFAIAGTSGHQRERPGVRGEGRELAPAGAQGAVVHEAEPGRGGARLSPRGRHHQRLPADHRLPGEKLCGRYGVFSNATSPFLFTLKLII